MKDILIVIVALWIGNLIMGRLSKSINYDKNNGE
jgi:hypothetical protein